jgi:hypothetical protein
MESGIQDTYQPIRTHSHGVWVARRTQNIFKNDRA